MALHMDCRMRGGFLGAALALLGLAGTASAGYEQALAAARLEKRHALFLDALLAQPAGTLADNGPLLALLEENRGALESFRLAAQEPNDGRMFPGDADSQYVQHVMLFNLLLLDARLSAAGGRRAEQERDLLAAAGFLAQVSEQRVGTFFSLMIWQLCFQKAYPFLSESLRGKPVSSRYLDDLAARLGRTASVRDFIEAAMREEAEAAKASVRRKLDPAGLDAMLGKKNPLDRWAASRLLDADFLEIAYKRFDAGADERARVFVNAFLVADAAIADDFMKKHLEELRARGEAYAKRGALAKLADALTRSAEAKSTLADLFVDLLTRSGVPRYAGVIMPYHSAVAMLAVLRTALAVEAYRARWRRPPENLESLAPRLPPQAARDPFRGGAPLAYRVEGRGFAVYSVGPDRKDDGGSAAFDPEAYAKNPAQAAGDIVFAD